jgi:outer membrane protein assembly factor BamD (BamD/ComL family)
VFEKNNMMIRPAQINITVGQSIDPQIYYNMELKDLAEHVRQIIVENLDDNSKAS